MKQKRQRKRPKSGEPQRITKAITHIRLFEANAGKLAALDTLAPVYLALCQHYVTLFCTEEQPNKLRDPLFHTPLSERWHRVAIMQAAGIARAFRSNRSAAYQQYHADLEQYQKRAADGTVATEFKESQWRQWTLPTLRARCLHANVNVVKIASSPERSF